MLRVILGLLKGGVVGGALGYGAHAIGVSTGVLGYLVYAVIGFVVGVVCGKPLWRHETLWTPVVKGVIGALVCAGLYWGASKLLGGVPAPAFLGLEEGTVLAGAPFVLGPAIGILYGILVEVDDGRPDKKSGGAAADRDKAPKA